MTSSFSGECCILVNYWKINSLFLEIKHLFVQVSRGGGRGISNHNLLYVITSSLSCIPFCFNCLTWSALVREKWPCRMSCAVIWASFRRRILTRLLVYTYVQDILYRTILKCKMICFKILHLLTHITLQPLQQHLIKRKLMLN